MLFVVLYDSRKIDTEYVCKWGELMGLFLEYVPTDFIFSFLFSRERSIP
jgi:hypothetical protein